MHVLGIVEWDLLWLNADVICDVWCVITLTWRIDGIEKSYWLECWNHIGEVAGETSNVKSPTDVETWTAKIFRFFRHTQLLICLFASSIRWSSNKTRSTLTGSATGSVWLSYRCVNIPAHRMTGTKPVLPAPAGRFSRCLLDAMQIFEVLKRSAKSACEYNYDDTI